MLDPVRSLSLPWGPPLQDPECFLTKQRYGCLHSRAIPAIRERCCNAQSPFPSVRRIPKGSAYDHARKLPQSEHLGGGRRSAALGLKGLSGLEIERGDQRPAGDLGAGLDPDRTQLEPASLKGNVDGLGAECADMAGPARDRGVGSRAVPDDVVDPYLAAADCRPGAR